MSTRQAPLSGAGVSRWTTVGALCACLFGANCGAKTVKPLSTKALLKMERDVWVARALLGRAGVPLKDRLDCLQRVAKADGTSPAKVLWKLVTKPADERLPSYADLAATLPALPADALKDIESGLSDIAQDAEGAAALRTGAMAALLATTDDVDTLFEDALQAKKSLIALVRGVPMVQDAQKRGALYEKIKPLLGGWPEDLQYDEDSPRDPARFVRIELPRRGALALAEVHILSGEVNVAGLGKATQSSGSTAQNAIDNNADTQTHTNKIHNNPWWEVDLGSDVNVKSITVWTHPKVKIAGLKDFTVKVLSAERETLFQKKGNKQPDPKLEIPLDDARASRIEAAALAALQSMPGHEAERLAEMITMLKKGILVPHVLRAILAMERKPVPAKLNAQLAEAVAGALPEVPYAMRNRDVFTFGLKLGRHLADDLPEEQAKRVRAKLSNLDRIVIRITTVREKMRYDRKEFTVKAGKPVRILFTNADYAPHNLMIVKPGGSDIVGPLAEQLGAKGIELQWRPESDLILHGTGMVDMDESATLDFIAPATPGKYEYVCTFPQHWRMMRGIMRVVP